MYPLENFQWLEDDSCPFFGGLTRPFFRGRTVSFREGSWKEKQHGDGHDDEEEDDNESRVLIEANRTETKIIHKKPKHTNEQTNKLIS